MRFCVARTLAAGSLIGVAVLVSACRGSDTAASTTEPSTTAPSSTQSTTSAPTSSTKQAHATTTSAQADTAGGTDDQPVDCGKIDGPSGQVGLLAESTPAGTVGCTEAINVISEYYRDAPTKSEGTAHVLTVDGWQCLADTGAQGTGMIGCEKGGLAFHTQP